MGRRGRIIRSVRFGVAGGFLQWAPAGPGDDTGQGPPEDRRRGDEQRTSFLRKGLVGDRANDFTRSAVEAFDRSRGEVLIRAGSEADRSRVESCTQAHSDTTAQRAAGNRS